LTDGWLPSRLTQPKAQPPQAVKGGLDWIVIFCFITIHFLKAKSQIVRALYPLTAWGGCVTKIGKTRGQTASDKKFVLHF